MSTISVAFGLKHIIEINLTTVSQHCINHCRVVKTVVPEYVIRHSAYSSYKAGCEVCGHHTIIEAFKRVGFGYRLIMDLCC